MINARRWAKRGVALIIADGSIVAAWLWGPPQWPVPDDRVWWSDGYPGDYNIQKEARERSYERAQGEK